MVPFGIVYQGKAYEKTVVACHLALHCSVFFPGEREGTWLCFFPMSEKDGQEEDEKVFSVQFSIMVLCELNLR